MKLSRYKLTFVSQSKIKFENNQFPGSSLRGVFGTALRVVTCVTGREHCEGCTQKSQCTFPLVFKTSKIRKGKVENTPQPLVLDMSEVPRNIDVSETFSIYVNLIGDYDSHLPSILEAWNFAGKLGINHQGRSILFQLLDVDIVDTAAPKNNPNIESISIHLITPHLATRREGVARQKKEITADTFITNTYLVNILRRYGNLKSLYDEVMPKGEYRKLDSACHSLFEENKAITDVAYKGKSLLQNERRDFSGVVGQFTMSGKALETLYPLLWLGQWLHVGNKPMFGMGRYALEVNKNGKQR